MMRPTSLRLVNECMQGLNHTMRVAFGLGLDIGPIGVPELPPSIAKASIREPGFLESEPPASWEVNDLQWPKALPQPPSKRGNMLVRSASSSGPPVLLTPSVSSSGIFRTVLVVSVITGLCGYLLAHFSKLAMTLGPDPGQYELNLG